MKQQKALTLKTLTKSNAWDLQENDVLRMWEAAEKDADLKDNMRHYLDVIRSAFEIEEIKVDRPEVIDKYKERGYKVATLRIDEKSKNKWAIKKRPIMRVSDLTYENIHHISAEKLMEVLERNFGGGWESLSQSVQDIIEYGFDISTTTLPKERLHKPGGMYEKKMNSGYSVLEIEKGAWVEAIFAKAKPVMEKFATIRDNDDELEDGMNNLEIPDADENEAEFLEEEDDSFDDDKLTEESYRTTFETDPDVLEIEAEEESDSDENY